jgi:hypothetical protein
VFCIFVTLPRAAALLHSLPVRIKKLQLVFLVQTRVYYLHLTPAPKLFLVLLLSDGKQEQFAKWLAFGSQNCRCLQWVDCILHASRYPVFLSLQPILYSSGTFSKHDSGTLKLNPCQFSCATKQGSSWNFGGEKEEGGTGWLAKKHTQLMKFFESTPDNILRSSLPVL